MSQEQMIQSQQSQIQDVVPRRISLRKSINDDYVPVKDTFMTFRTRQQDNSQITPRNNSENVNAQASKKVEQQQSQPIQQEKILQSPTPIKKDNNEILTVDQLPTVNPVQQAVNTSKMKHAAEEMQKYIPLVEYNPKNYYQLPKGNSRQEFSFIKQDTMNYSYRRPTLGLLYKSNTIIHPNRYNTKYHQSSLPLDQYNVIVPKQGKKADYVPQDNDFLTPEQPKIRRKEREQPFWDKKTQWEKKIYIRQRDPIQRVPVNCLPEEATVQHKKQTEDTKKQQLSHVSFNNGFLQGTQLQQRRGKHVLRPVDHKSVFIPYDEKYGVDKFKGLANDSLKQDLTKSGMRPLSQIKQPIQRVAGVKSGQEFEQIDSQVQ